jgi:hypothetical protein
LEEKNPMLVDVEVDMSDHEERTVLGKDDKEKKLK